MVVFAAGLTRATLPGEVLLPKAVDTERDGLARLHFADAVGGHDEPFEAHAGGIDDLQQLLADLGRVAVRNLAVAHDAVERRAHFGALELLASGDDASARRLTITLRGVAAVLSILELLGRYHARACCKVCIRWNWRSACSYACTAAFSDAVADIRLSRIDVSSSRTSRSPFFTGSPFSLQHGDDDGRDLGAQVGTALRLHRARDGRAGGERVVAQGDEVFRRNEQGRRRQRLVGRGCARTAHLLAGR